MCILVYNVWGFDDEDIFLFKGSICSPMKSLKRNLNTESLFCAPLHHIHVTCENALYYCRRLTSFDERQESMLTMFVQFLESRLLSGSREKRSVAWKLLVTTSAL